MIVSPQLVEDLPSLHRVVSSTVFFQNVIELFELRSKPRFILKEIFQIAMDAAGELGFPTLIVSSVITTSGSVTGW